MSEDKEKDGIVIDVEPEPAAPEPSESPEASGQDAEPGQAPADRPNEPPAATARQRSSWPSLLLAIVALLLVIGLAYVGVQRWTGINDEMRVLSARFDTALKAQQNLQAAVDTANAAITAQQQLMEQQRVDVAQQQTALNEQIQGISSERRQMNLREAELKTLVDDIHQRIGRTDSQWRVAEAEYLIRIAINRVQLARDIKTARAALLLADERLRDTAEPQWDGVRQQLARDIAALDSVALPDTAGISARLSALAGQVPSLALASQHLPEQATDQDQATRPRESRSWSTLADDMLAGLKDSVRIRRTDAPVHALLTPDQQHFLYQNLALQLETARLALLQGDADAYRDTLAKARQWVIDLFDTEQAATSNMLSSIDELLATDVAPPMPDITASLSLLLQRQTLAASSP